jgi:2-keto-4-pentenoate hydratase/2-oxohepta-3-ene-1,7-dioic acid hydratase in catechol pathway
MLKPAPSETTLRFLRNHQAQWGHLQGEKLQVLTAAPWADPKPTGEWVKLDDITLLAPAEPSKIVCVGLNYRDHAAEMGHVLPPEPVIFLKPPSTLLDPGQPIRRPPSSSRVDYEAELALVIGKKVGPGMDTADAIFGFTCANDVTARDLQKKDGQWTRAKGFDTFCPMGPLLVRGVDVSDARIQCLVNGKTVQDSRTSQLIFGPQAIVNFVAGIMTLLPGDAILTGTPGGIGPLHAGDTVEVRIEGVGALTNQVLDR